MTILFAVFCKRSEQPPEAPSKRVFKKKTNFGAKIQIFGKFVKLHSFLNFRAKKTPKNHNIVMLIFGRENSKMNVASQTFQIFEISRQK